MPAGANAAIVRKYGEYLWFDPGEPAAEDHFIAVLNDVVKRYDIDGVHIDDYFYPYQITRRCGENRSVSRRRELRRAVDAGETLMRDDWRRQNVNRLIERMYEEVKRAKPWVLVGISPFGIWRPGHPEGITGLDQYDALYADVRKWLHEGWLDYLTPQLYWRVDSEEQSYPKLLGWWHEQNVKQRHLWPGNFTSKVRREPDVAESRDAWSADELLRQIEVNAQPARRERQRSLQHEGAHAQLRRHRGQAQGGPVRGAGARAGVELARRRNAGEAGSRSRARWHEHRN